MVNAWMDDQRRRIAEDRFLYASTYFLATAPPSLMLGRLNARGGLLGVE